MLHFVDMSLNFPKFIGFYSCFPLSLFAEETMPGSFLHSGFGWIHSHGTASFTFACSCELDLEVSFDSDSGFGKSPAEVVPFGFITRHILGCLFTHQEPRDYYTLMLTERRSNAMKAETDLKEKLPLPAFRLSFI